MWGACRDDGLDPRIVVDRRSVVDGFGNLGWDSVTISLSSVRKEKRMIKRPERKKRRKEKEEVKIGVQIGPTPEPIGTPKILRKYDDKCPLCHGDTMVEIEVEVKCEMLKGGKGIGIYLSCAGCGLKGPMLIRATKD